jgi:hypothetical protein
MDRLVYMYLLGGDGVFRRPRVYSAEEKPQVALLPDLAIDLVAVFA